MDELGKIVLVDNPNYLKIRLIDYEWSVLLAKKEVLFSAITRTLLNIENLYFYSTQKESTKTLEETREYIMDRVKVKGSLINDLQSILQEIGWYPTSNIDIDSKVFHGDIGELLMCELIDQLDISRTLISKVSLKTSPNVSSFGNDNVFYDLVEKTLYYGESKFFSKLEDALLDAYNSVKEHSKNTTEISYIVNHSGVFIAENGATRNEIIEEFDTVNVDDLKIGTIIFAMFDNVYKKEDVEKLIGNFVNKHRPEVSFLKNLHLVLFPVLSKKELLSFIVEQVEQLYEQ